ncbi:hypothetical protein L226DRAFT_147236 [Lentinus tigrinus ALCF2SS1-7]|uniref:Uncharacterized protein n=1 Tax=Lentinus tigrinus ALCF2SS1-6 TaxID=1328759 RepID=A0A5C2S4R4_9APHY|nr:hypothetical protein L227DRAFT_180718 [Lentinus tigrinus ALCF2SS1-6]RPD72795.1 hypothetical protein L226DRAFT_147236 [Lentinus tigrinus ALCF2SS1-7]
MSHGPISDSDAIAICNLQRQHTDSRLPTPDSPRESDPPSNSNSPMLGPGARGSARSRYGHERYRCPSHARARGDVIQVQVQETEEAVDTLPVSVCLCVAWEELALTDTLNMAAAGDLLPPHAQVHSGGRGGGGPPVSPSQRVARVTGEGPGSRACTC